MPPVAQAWKSNACAARNRTAPACVTMVMASDAMASPPDAVKPMAREGCGRRKKVYGRATNRPPAGVSGAGS